MRFDESQHYCVIRMAIDAEDGVGAAIELCNSFFYRAVEVTTTFKCYSEIFPLFRPINHFAVESYLMGNFDGFAKEQKF